MTSGPSGEGAVGDGTWLVGAAVGCVLLGALALAGGILFHFLGYALASLLAFSLIALFRRRSSERSLTQGIGVPRWVRLVAVGALLAGFAISIIHSWFIASYFS
jgi:hypothetical protein